MRPVAVIGGGPAGAMAAEKLARGGLDTILIDEKLAWEKPCGGGLTYKAYDRYPFLLRNDARKRVVGEVRMSAPRAGPVRLRLERPLVIYSRTELNGLLLERAAAAGARIEKARVTGLSRGPRGWRLETPAGSLEAGYCVIANGARNGLREAGTRWTPSDTMVALGYRVPSNQEHADFDFLPRLAGYIWVFPRRGHLSVGICGKGQPAALLRAQLEAYMRERGMATAGASFYSHVLPSLGEGAWRANRVAGEGWLATGDAAGLVDPITGEGLYYAMRSGDLAADVILADRPDNEKADSYRSCLTHDFAADLEYGAHLARRFFHGRFLWGSVPSRMIQFMRRSKTIEGVVRDLFAGTQGYLGLKSRLLGSLHAALREVLTGWLLHRPGEREPHGGRA